MPLSSFVAQSCAISSPPRVGHGARGIGDRDDAVPRSRRRVGEPAPGIAEALQRDGEPAVLAQPRQIAHRFHRDMRPAPGRGCAPRQPAERHRLAGKGVPLDRTRDLRIFADHPRHLALPGGDIGRGHVAIRPEDLRHRAHIAARDALLFHGGEIVRVDRDPTLAAAEGQAHQRAFHAHQEGQRLDLVETDRLVEADAALGRPERGIIAAAPGFQRHGRPIVAPQVDRCRERFDRVLEMRDHLFVEAEEFGGTVQPRLRRCQKFAHLPPSPRDAASLKTTRGARAVPRGD